ncbi:DNA-directed RNA polymerase subunit alpha C-terminal domain-containing protein [Variovorax ginsengisoli]|uniref:DNA-directed RNA polymerase subunit alpha C-terminal domain-containing protein n=1 Tax=Variovorax ginsengisoli TaxID=363844 RepID=A0ABT8S342_9BURK|nr:DNA-directed RNA polymerase subunit alpha C-terminal domain-containing protein [Variovorax ginsengisoli]MDN8614180.1 DNA-directed RNA polymerase subunit alpha C-terminal domain-containing protein [Variovorax ginsengisoli]MDO1533350.1 DNA-directed RNA polymerase subunit alpha C-terminal domain-containing protein [Variovorax ginsengisoli]
MDPRHPARAATPDPILDADIAVLRLCDRTTNLLRVNELNTVRDLVRLPARKLFALSRLGRNSLREIVDSIDRQGLRLAE